MAVELAMELGVVEKAVGGSGPSREGKEEGPVGGVGSKFQKSPCHPIESIDPRHEDVTPRE